MILFTCLWRWLALRLVIVIGIFLGQLCPRGKGAWGRNVSHQQQFFSQLPLPRRSRYTNYWYSWVETIYYTTAICCLKWLWRFKCLATGLDVFFRLSLRHEGFLGIGRLGVAMFRRCITLCKQCKLCSRWHLLRYRWNDQWTWWIDWRPIFSEHYEWLHHARAHLKVPGSHLFAMHFWLKSYLCFCRVWMKWMEAAKRFYQYRDHFKVI